MGATRRSEVRERPASTGTTGLKRRFVLTMTGSLALVLLIAACALFKGATEMVDEIERETFVQTAVLSQRAPLLDPQGEGELRTGGIEIREVLYGSEKSRATLFRVPKRTPGEKDFDLIVPETKRVHDALLGLIGLTMGLVVVAAAVLAFWVAGRVTRPVDMIIHDVRSISHGQLKRRITPTGASEMATLARSIQRMSGDLQEAQDAKLELSIRERELSLAADIREALVPVATPLLAGYDIGAVHLSSHNIGGDFHDYIELQDGRVGLLVCDVSGQGMPAALIGAIARSYLRGELLHVDAGAGTEGVAEALRRANRWIGRDVRPGIYATALYALVDPARGRAIVASAGHKIPLLRVSADDGKLRTVHPEGIALGLDRGAVFDRRLEVAEVPLQPGDRLFLCNSAPVRLLNAEGRELGEKAFFARVLKHAPLPSLDFLKALRNDLLAFAGEEGVSYDISLVTISRDS
jgi:serine phosphatase RsbU (regulator of sigma subunit)